ncbi:unnamed protein product, partial [Urochloa humidicola]
PCIASAPRRQVGPLPPSVSTRNTISLLSSSTPRGRLRRARLRAWRWEAGSSSGPGCARRRERLSPPPLPPPASAPPPPPPSTDGLHSASPIALASWTTRRHPYGGRARRRQIRPQHQLLAPDLNPTPPNRAGPPRRCRRGSGRRRKGGKVASTGEESETERLERRSRRRKAESCRHPAPLPASPSPPSARAAAVAEEAPLDGDRRTPTHDGDRRSGVLGPELLRQLARARGVEEPQLYPAAAFPTR